MHKLEQPSPIWRKSSHSNGVGGECVEVAAAHDYTLIRDSKNPDGPILTFRNTALSALLNGLRAHKH